MGPGEDEACLMRRRHMFKRGTTIPTPHRSARRIQPGSSYRNDHHNATVLRNSSTPQVR
jgi:hypothetical protein